MTEPFPYGRYFGEILTLADLQFQDAPRPFTDRPPADPERKDLLLYLGCNVLRTPHLATSAIAVLRAMGFDFNAVAGPAYCCGVIHHRAGDTGPAAAYAGATLRHLGAFGAQHVIMWCPSCVEHYDGVVSAQHEVPFPYEHITEFIVRHLDRVRFVRRLEHRVAMHYHTGHPRQDADWTNARTILSAIPGIEYVHVPNPPSLGRHCSPNYINRLGRPGWDQEIARVVAAATEARADVLATVYHSCHREICEREAGRGLAIIGYIDLLAEAMGLATAPDWYKRHKIAGDPEAAFDEVRGWVEARGLDPVRVREVLAHAFAPPCAAPPASS